MSTTAHAALQGAILASAATRDRSFDLGLRAVIAVETARRLRRRVRRTQIDALTTVLHTQQLLAVHSVTRAPAAACRVAPCHGVCVGTCLR